jgi:phosphonate transport system substrate-binding protein
MNLRFGTYLAPNIFPLYRFIAQTVGDRLGISTEIVVETTYESCQRDENDVCFVCSLPYVVFQRAGSAPALPVAAPVLIGDRFAGRPIYFSDVIVGRDSPARAFRDLRGHSWAYNEPLSQSGYGITRYHLLQMGETRGFFGKVIEAGYHEVAIRMVASGEVDASAIDCHVLAVALRDDPALAARLRIIDSLGPSTIQPVAVSKRLPAGLREEIAHILVSLADEPAARARLAESLVAGFVRIDDAAYDDIRMMLKAVEDAGFQVLR